MIYIFYDKKRHDKEDIELIYSFETPEEYIQYMIDDYYMTDNFDIPDAPVAGIVLDPSVDGLDSIDEGDSGGFDSVATYAIIVNTDDSGVYQSYWQPYMDMAITLDRDKRIDNLMKE